MQWYQIATLIVSVLSLCGFGVVAKMFWEDRHAKRKEQSEEAKRRKKQERHREILEAVEEGTKEHFGQINERLDNMSSRLEVSEECDRASLRNGLMNLYYSCEAKGYRTEDDSKNYREMHEAYNKAGGNSFIDSDVSRWFDDIPLKPNEYGLKKMAQKHKKSTKKEDK